MVFSRTGYHINLQPVHASLIGLLLILTGCIAAHAQEQEESPKRFFDKFTITPLASFQIYGSYTTGARLYNRDSMTYGAVESRFNFVLRRTRLGVSVGISEDISFNIIAAMDNVGRDILAGLTGGANNGNFPNVGVWNASAQWRLKRGSEAFNLVLGYHTPFFSRESLVPWGEVGSYDKSISQFYIRRHLTGKNPGRQLGMSFGGMVRPTDNFAIQYTTGLFNPVFTRAINNSAGINSSPLINANVCLYFGDPEYDKYHFGHTFNTLGQRNGLTLGFSGSYEGDNGPFDRRTAFAIDILYNKGPWNIGGEWAFLRTDAIRDVNGNNHSFTINAQTGMARAIYNIPLSRERILAVSGTYMFYFGEDDATGVEDAMAVESSAGSHTKFDFGVNFHLIPRKVRVEAHYAWQSGTTPGGIPGVNDFFEQSGVLLQKGNYAGIALVLQL